MPKLGAFPKSPDAEVKGSVEHLCREAGEVEGSLGLELMRVAENGTEVCMGTGKAVAGNAVIQRGEQ